MLANTIKNAQNKTFLASNISICGINHDFTTSRKFYRTAIKVNTDYSNGEYYSVYTPEILKYDHRAYPRVISLSWHKINDLYVANIRLDKSIILDVFQQMVKKVGENGRIDFCVDISKYNNLLKFSLESGEHKIELPEKATKIMVFIPTQDHKVIYCSNNWSDDTDGIGGDYFNEYYVIKK